MATQTNRNVEINKLPLEVLTQIFFRVPITERNSIRLVCRRWYEVCNSPFIYKHEKFVFSGIHSLKEITSVLLASDRQSFNLEFHNIKFNESTSAFWRKCGHKIRELEFIDCDISDGIIEFIVTYCHKLTHLSWVCENCFAKGTLWSENVLTKLLAQNITRENLTSIEINLCRRRSMSNYLFNAIFTLFPKIRRFYFFYPLDRGFNSLALDPEGKRQDIFTFSSIFNKLEACGEEIEILKLGSPLCAGFDWKAIALLSQLTKLQEIEINDDILSVPEVVFTTFISKQKYLKSIKCTIRYAHARPFIEKLLQCLLINCVHLQHLHLSYNGLVDISQELLQRFVDSKLKSLIIRCVDIKVTIPQKLPENYILRSFTLGSYSLESYRILSFHRQEEIRLALLRIFRNLRFLEMNLLTDEILQGIWKYQNNIGALRLSIRGSCTDYGFTGFTRNGVFTGYSMNTLKDLQYLELVSHENMRYLTKNVFVDLNLPNLKYFRILLLGDHNFYDPLVLVLRRCTLLEGLCIRPEKRGISYLKLAEMISNLKRLRFLSILGGSKERSFCEEKYENMFNLCPSLRFLVHRTVDNCEKYYYDFLNQKVMKKTSLKWCVIPAENYETYYVDWMSL